MYLKSFSALTLLIGSTHLSTVSGLVKWISAFRQ